MKKYFSLMAIAATVMLGFASCSDDEGSTNPTVPGGSTMADKVAGIYDSQIAVSINGNDLQPSNYAVEITKSSDTEIKFTLRDFSTEYEGQTIPVGTIELDGVEIAEVNNAYSFAKIDTLSLPIFGEEPTDVPLNLTGTFTDTTIDANIDINFMGKTIVVDINGTKRGTSEGGDQPSEPELTMAQEIAGDYACNIAVELNGTQLPASENTVTIEAVNDSTVNFVLRDFSVSLGDTSITPTDENGEAKITLTNVALTKSNGAVVFTAQQTPNLVIAEGAPAISVPIVASGSFADNNMDAQINIELGDVMVIAVSIKGQK